jgi:hypothetical protein
MFALAMALQQTLSKYGDIWSVLGLGFVSLAGFLVFISVRRQWRNRKDV